MLAVIGDVHGSIKTLKKLYYTLMDKYLIHRIVFLGDIVDRGLYSKEVVEFLMDRQGECLMTFLCGNHEDMLINSIENEKRYPNFCWHERVGLNTHYPYMWHTKTKNYKSKYFDYILIHGHEAIVNKNSTAEELDNVYPLIYKDSAGEVISINIDTGCCYHGKLTAIIIDENGNYTFEIIKCDD